MLKCLKLTLVLTLLFTLATAAHADVFVTKTQLEAWGIQSPAFRLMVLSGNGQVLIGAEKELDLRLRASGLGYKMRIFRINGDKLSVDTIQLPLAEWNQTGINDDGTQALVSGELGAKILEVDLVSHKYRVVMTHTAGEPGFRNDPQIIWNDGDGYLMTGYHYGPDGAAGPDEVARVNLAQSGIQAFESLADVIRIEKKTSPKYMTRIIMAPDQAVFMGPLRPHGQLQELKVYDKGKVILLDSGVVYGTLAATRNRVLYSVRRPGKAIQHQETWLRDFESGKKWQIGEEDVPYQYGFISRDGKTIAISRIDLRARRMTMLYGREADGFKLKPIPGLSNVDLGNFRLAALGTGWAWLDNLGLRMGTLPAPSTMP